MAQMVVNPVKDNRVAANRSAGSNYSRMEHDSP